LKAEKTQVIEEEQARIDELDAEWKANSLLGRMGRAIEPAVRPLGWDWRIGMAALASFPAREVVVGTLGIIYHQGKVETDEIREAENPGDRKSTRLNSSHSQISYAVFCLKKKKNTIKP